MKKFDVLKSITDERKFCDLLFDLIGAAGTREEFVKLISDEMTEEQLQTVKSVADSDYPLSLDRIQ